jgi:hypothetical protein
MKRPNTFSELFDLLESRRGLYTKRSIICLRAFIDGWLFGGDLAPGGMDILAAFEASLQKRHGLENTSWDRILLLYSQDDCGAYETFFDEFKRFLKEQPPT